MSHDLNTAVLVGRNILVIDDHDNIRVSLRLILEGEGVAVHEAATVKDAKQILETNLQQFDVILLDVRLPDGNGLDVLQELSENNVAQKVIMISGEGTVTDAFKATQMGAFDYIEKPFTPERILVSVSRLLSFDTMQKANTALQQQVQKGYEILGDSAKIQKVIRLIKRVAPTNGRVLVTGESGTGKELVARAVHRHSQRADKPLIKVNCAAIPHSLIESELFGHEKGAFTGALKSRKGVFERAHNGSLFLDEIGELDLDVQAKLLRVLQSGELMRVGSEKVETVDVRLIAATNRDLEDMVQTGKFREDLFYRLNVVTISVPPLRERKEDIPTLANWFLELACEENSLGQRLFTKTAIDQLVAYHWPGNIRELRNLVERVAILSESENILHVEGLNKPSTKLKTSLDADANHRNFAFETEIVPWQEFHQAAGRDYIKYTLRFAKGNVSEAARILCLERAYLHRLMRKLNVQRDVVVQD